MREALKKIGLTNSEISVYLCLFELGSSTASKIAEKSKLHRTNAYDCLSRLIGKGLASCTTKDNRKYFNATDANNLLSYIDKQKHELERSKKQIAALAAELKKTTPTKAVSSRIEAFQGKIGLASFYEKLIEMAASKDEILIIGSSERILEIFNYYLLNLTKKAGHIKISVKMVANHEIMKNKYMQMISLLIKIEMRYVPIDYLSPVAAFIFKDYVGFCNFMENPFVLLVNDRAISDSYRKHFSMMWNAGRK